MRLRLGILCVFVGCCAISACSAGGVGGGTSTLPGGQLPPLGTPQTTAPQPTASPNSASATVLVGDGTMQTLPALGDYRVTAVFPQTSASPVILKVTVSAAGPAGIAPYGETSAKKRMFAHYHTLSPALLYVTFSSDKDVTVSELPALNFTVPISKLEPFGTDPVLDLALYDPANESKWMQRVAEKEFVTPSPAPSGASKAVVTAPPTPSPSPSPTPTPGPSGSAVVTPVRAVTTPPGPVAAIQLRFVPTSRTMKLLAKKNLVFVLYAQPAATPPPSASPSPRGAASSASPSSSATSSSSTSSSTEASATPSPKPSAT